MRILALALFAVGCNVCALDLPQDLPANLPAGLPRDLPRKYDPARNPAKDAIVAALTATAQRKHILMVVGGEWCVWCHIMDDFVAANPDVSAAVTSNYVILNVNWSPENKNEAFLSQFPKIAGYPHVFVLNDNGVMLHSQQTDVLEQGRSYDKGKFLAFLTKWAPSRTPNK